MTGWLVGSWSGGLVLDWLVVAVQKVDWLWGCNPNPNPNLTLTLRVVGRGDVVVGGRWVGVGLPLPTLPYYLLPLPTLPSR